MTYFQTYNPRTDSWTKFKKTGKKTTIVNVKQGSNKAKPFKGVRVK